jgi:hypothetical protein
VPYTRESVPNQSGRTVVATELVFWVAPVRLATRAPVVPVAVTSPDPRVPTPALSEYLGVRVRQGPQHRVTFSARDASRPFLTSHAAMGAVVEPDLRRPSSRRARARPTGSVPRSTSCFPPDGPRSRTSPASWHWGHAPSSGRVAPRRG